MKKPKPKTFKQLQSALNTAMTTLRQIASTPRNKGARRNAWATVAFLETQMPDETVEQQSQRIALAMIGDEYEN
jgi:hypothetical protein